MMPGLDAIVWIADAGRVELVRVTHVTPHSVYGLPVDKEEARERCVPTPAVYADKHSAMRHARAWCETQATALTVMLNRLPCGSGWHEGERTRQQGAVPGAMPAAAQMAGVRPGA